MILKSFTVSFRCLMLFYIGTTVHYRMFYGPFASRFIFNPFNFVYLTVQVNFLCSVYLLLGIISEVFNLKKLKNIVNELSLTIFSLSTIVSSGYYLLIHNTPKMIKLRAADPLLEFYMFVLHCLIEIAASIDFLIVSSKGFKSNLKTNFIMTTCYFLFYIVYSMILYFINYQWPYEFQNKFTFVTNFMLGFVFLITTSLFLLLGYKINTSINNNLSSKKNLKKIKQ